MRVAVFGAIGRQVVDQLLDAVHEVVAFVRSTVLPIVAGLAFPNAPRELGEMTAAVIRSGFRGRDKVGSAMGRADIATFFVQQLTDTRYLCQPAISN